MRRAEIAGILEELVQREAEARTAARPRRSKAGASGPSRRNAAISESQTLSAASKGSSDGGALPAGEFIRASEQELASLAAETRASGGARRSATASGSGSAAARMRDHEEIVSES